MKELREVILEKLRVDNIVLTAEFPIDGTIDDIIAFLENADFTYVLCNKGIDECFNKYKSKCFYKNSEYFYFADTSKEKISKNNPIFLIKSISNMLLFSVYCITYDEMAYKVRNNKQEFLKELNKRFGWK